VISLLPSYSETIVTTLTTEEIAIRFQQVTAETVQWDQEFKLPQDKIFYGYVQATHFQIAARNMRLLSFNPLVLGKIEATKNGSILFLRYQLFILTRLLVLFWTVFLMMASTILFIIRDNFWYGAGTLMLLVSIHLVLRANFHLQVKPTQQAISTLLDR
jgi:hypothetical protein